MMLKQWIATLLIALCSFALDAQAGEREEIVNAQQIATVWLALLDDKQYGQSWDTASTFWQHDHDRAKTEAILGNLRGALGTLIKREMVETEFLHVPDGDCVRLQFKSWFTNQPAVTENVELLREKDGQWRVSLWSHR